VILKRQGVLVCLWLALHRNQETTFRLLGDAIGLKVVSAIAFIATKLDAFDDRGGGDYQASHDLDDIISVVDGRERLISELAVAPREMAAYVAERIGRMLDEDAFVDAIAGHLPGDNTGQARLPIVLARLRALAGRS